jgi:integrase
MPTIRRRGNKWQAMVRKQGHDHVSRSFTHRSDAEVWARSQEVDQERRGLPTSLRVLKRTTVQELLIRYRDEVSSKKKSRDMETYVINAILREPFVLRRLHELTPDDFTGYRDRRLKAVSPGGLRRQMTILKHVFTVAFREWGVPLPVNPMAAISMPKTNPARTRRLMDGEWIRLTGALKECRQKDMEPLVRLALLTGMRRGELLALKASDVDLKRQIVWVRVSKNGHPRAIPLSPRALTLVRDQAREKSDALFDLTAEAVKKSWQRVVVRAGLSDLHFHDLRHEAISSFFELGLTAPEVASISGHRDARQLMRYAHALMPRIHAKLAAGDNNASTEGAREGTQRDSR